jgi:transposase
MGTDASLPDDPAALRALLLAEREQIEHDRRVERERYEQLVAGFEETIVRQQRRLEQQQHEIARLLRRLCGPRQERIDPDQLLLFDAGELAALAAELDAADREVAEHGDEADASGDEPSSPSRRRRGHGRNPLPEHLPRERVVHELPEAERACPCCGGLRHVIGEETSEQLEYVPASLKVLVHVRPKYACRSCEEHVAIAAKPPQPIDRGLPGPGLLAWVALAKHGDHLPLYRQEDVLARHGVTIRRSTLCDWIAAAAELATPLHERMCELVRRSRVIHTDDTSVPLLDPLLGRARQARFWAYVGDDAHPYSVYDFTDDRGRDGPARFLEGFEGYLQADAYGGYDGLYADPRRRIVEVACWAHCRRYWWEARTTDVRRGHEALAFVARLYEVERHARERSPAERLALRRAHALPVLASFRTWLDAEQPHVLPKSPIGAAFRYTLNQWEALGRYCEDGDLAIDNNVSERTVKPAALGRKNWLFVASETGGRRAAVLFGLVASAKRNGVEPYAWLRDLFTRLPLLAADRNPGSTTDESPTGTPNPLDDLLPDRWLVTHPQHRWNIDDLRRRERSRRPTR